MMACIDGIASYTCTCTDGYEGDTCEIDIDDCLSNPCQNDGTCIDGIANYTCSCSDGFEGNNCESNIDDCLSNPCQYDGTCIDGIANYTCSCSDGFEGNNCESNIDDCLSNPCQYDATCIDGIANYTCLCADGFEGDNCESNIDDCESNPCQNGATCRDDLVSYSCSCIDGFEGDNCQVNIDECLSNPCKNNGICIDDINNYICDCKNTGYEGNNCETNINECDTDNPCKNDGKCIDSIGSYQCICNDIYEGKNCDILIDDCLSNPCQNNGICQDLGFQKYECDCTLTKFIGTNCHIGYNQCTGTECNLVAKKEAIFTQIEKQMTIPSMINWNQEKKDEFARSLALQLINELSNESIEVTINDINTKKEKRRSNGRRLFSQQQQQQQQEEVYYDEIHYFIVYNTTTQQDNEHVLNYISNKDIISNEIFNDIFEQEDYFISDTDINDTLISSNTQVIIQDILNVTIDTAFYLLTDIQYQSFILNHDDNLSSLTQFNYDQDQLLYGIIFVYSDDILISDLSFIRVIYDNLDILKFNTNDTFQLVDVHTNWISFSYDLNPNFNNKDPNDNFPKTFQTLLQLQYDFKYFIDIELISNEFLLVVDEAIDSLTTDDSKNSENFLKQFGLDMTSIFYGGAASLTLFLICYISCKCCKSANKKIKRYK